MTADELAALATVQVTVLSRIDKVNRSAASPLNPRASACQCGTSRDSGHASAFSMCTSACTSSDVTA
jgi:hypothetical protein